MWIETGMFQVVAGEALIVGGRLFPALATATEKVQLPSVVHRVDGMTSNTVGQINKSEM